MPDNSYHVVDVFGEERYAGNQLAVVHDASNLSTDEMRAITRETNFSEATFVVGEPAVDGTDVRIFDPAEELPFAGHPTLGTAAVLREFRLDGRPDELTLNLGVGRIPVWIERSGDGSGGVNGEREVEADGETDEGAGNGDERYWMRQVPPEFGATVDRSLAARALGLDESALDDHPVQVVSTGLPTLIVPLRDLGAVERAGTVPDPYEELIETHGGLNVLAFAPETVADGDLHVRVFADWAGVPEDPATGSSNGCLAAWLVEHGYDAATDAEGRVDVAVEQGYEMGRPSRLHLRAWRAVDADGSDETVDASATDEAVDASATDEAVDATGGTEPSDRAGADDTDAADVAVEVGGRVIPVAEGRLL